MLPNKLININQINTINNCQSKTNISDIKAKNLGSVTGDSIAAKKISGVAANKINGKVNQTNQYTSKDKQQIIANTANTIKNLLNYFEQNLVITLTTVHQAQQKNQIIKKNTSTVLDATIVTETVQTQFYLKQRLRKAIKTAFIELFKVLFALAGIAI